MQISCCQLFTCTWSFVHGLSCHKMCFQWFHVSYVMNGSSTSLRTPISSTHDIFFRNNITWSCNSFIASCWLGLSLVASCLLCFWTGHASLWTMSNENSIFIHLSWVFLYIDHKYNLQWTLPLVIAIRSLMAILKIFYQQQFMQYSQWKAWLTLLKVIQRIFPI